MGRRKKFVCNLSYGCGKTSKRYIGSFSKKNYVEFIRNKVISKLPDYHGDRGHGRMKGEGARYPKSAEYYDERFETAVKEAVADAQRRFGDDFTKTSSISLANLKDTTQRAAPKTSRVVGVNYMKKDKKWGAVISYNGTQYKFGHIYETEEQGIEALAIAKREFFNFKGTPSKAELFKRSVKVREMVKNAVMGNVHDGQEWKCGNCGLDHPGKKKRCIVYAPGRSNKVIRGCGKWKGGRKPPARNKKRVKKVKVVDVPVHKTSASYPKKIQTVLEAGGLSTSDIEQKIQEVYHDDDLLNKTVFGNTLKTMVEKNELVKDGDVYSLPGSSDTTTTNRNEPKAKKYESDIDVDDASFNSDMLVDESEDEGEEEEDSDDNLTEESYDSEDNIDIDYTKVDAERAMKRKQAANDREDRAKRRRAGVPIPPLPAPVKKKKKVVRKVEEEEVPDPPLSEYELLRLGKIQRNKERLDSLGLGEGMAKEMKLQ